MNRRELATYISTCRLRYDTNPELQLSKLVTMDSSAFTQLTFTCQNRELLGRNVIPNLDMPLLDFRFARRTVLWQILTWSIHDAPMLRFHHFAPNQSKNGPNVIHWSKHWSWLIDSRHFTNSVQPYTKGSSPASWTLTPSRESSAKT